MKFFFILIWSFFLMGCSTHRLSDYKDRGPHLDLTEFFNGKLEAHGIVQDRNGRVIKQFVVKMNAHWESDSCTLDEDFYYGDGSTSKRIWKLKKIENKRFEGTAADVTGVAKGRVLGNAFKFDYVLQVPVDGKIYDVDVKDWMFLIDKNTMIARSYMTKWFFKVGEVSLVMRKVK